MTCGGWGCLPHLDGTDAGGAAFIIQYGLGDLNAIRGGHMCFPQLHCLCPVGACTVHYLRTASVLHNTIPHEATDAGRIVGTSLHMNKQFLNNCNSQINANGVGALTFLEYANEQAITEDTKKDWKGLKKLLALNSSDTPLQYV